MNIFKLSHLMCLLTLSSTLFAGHHSSSSSSSSTESVCEDCNLGTVGFNAGPPDWYELEIPNNPVTILLSQHANLGFKQGAISLGLTGLTINEPGDYQVSFSATMRNENPEYTPLIPIFLIPNGVFDPASLQTLGAVVALPPGFIITAQGSGVIANVVAGTTFSIIATNGGSPEPEPVTVIGWTITVSKLACDS